MRKTISLVLATLLVASVMVASVQAGNGSLKGRRAERMSQSTSWHGGYYDPAWGSPVALVVPPTAENQTKWSWGVGNTKVVPIWHQFDRPYYGEGGGGGTFRGTPLWPSSTDQFGDYYVRGPWK
jgi:hypothetical protein